MSNNLSVVIGADTTGLVKNLSEAKSILEKYKNAAKSASGEISKNASVTQSQVAAYNRVVNALTKVTSGTQTTTQQTKNLAKQIQELKIQWANLSAEGKASDFGKAVSGSLRSAEAQLATLKTQIAQTSTTTKEAKTTGDDFSGCLENMRGMFMKVTVAIAAVKSAFSIFEDVLKTNESSLDEWGRTVEGAKGAYHQFLIALNNGNWNNFFSNLSKAINGARQLYNEFDRLGSLKANNSAAIALERATIARLRRLKAEGKGSAEVDKQLREHTAILESLEKQQTTQGKKANRQGIINELKNRNPNMTQGAAEKIADQMIKNGQKVFDWADKNVKDIEKEAKRRFGKIRKTEYIDGQTVDVPLTTEEMIARLPQKMQSQYRNNKAVVQGESSYSPYIQGYASAVDEESQLMNRDNRNFKITGTTGGKGGKGGSGRRGKTEAQIRAEQLQNSIEKFQRSILTNIDESKIADRPIELPVTLSLSETKNPLAELEKSFTDINLEIPYRDWGVSDVQSYANAIQQLADNQSYLNEVMGQSSNLSLVFSENMKALTDISTAFSEITNNTLSNTERVAAGFDAAGKSLSMMGSAMSMAANAFNSKELNAAGIIAQALATLALSFAQAMTSASSNWITWLAFGLTGGATLLALTSQLTSMKSYANGGVIKGARSVGDMNYARVNSGEIIMNGTQQQRLWNILNGTTSYQAQAAQGGNVEFVLYGSDLHGSLKNYIKANPYSEL